jgi:outer membrane protein TolC
VDARIAAAGEREAAARVPQAQAWYWPRVDFVESWQRGDLPVFVFGSLLNQRRFTAEDFALDRLNHPDPVNNFRSAFTVEQLVFDGGAVRAQVRAARLGQEIARLSQTRGERELAVAATAAFGRVLAVEAARRAAASAVTAADEDLKRARARREAGLVTDADVLAIEVHRAQMRSREIAAAGEERVARAQLNQVIGAGLDEEFALDPVALLPDAAASLATLEAEAIDNRPEIKLADTQQRLADASVAWARAAFLPQVGAQAGVEWNGESFGSRESAWILGTQIRFNLFHGLADRARLAEARHSLTRRALEREKAETSVRLDVRSAMAQLESARARREVGATALTQARETQRILRDRYEAGLAGVTDLLRAAQSVLDAEAQDTASQVDVLIQAAALERALGR